MIERQRGNQDKQRKQIALLIKCLQDGEPVPSDIAYPVAARLTEYLYPCENSKQASIIKVLCKRQKEGKYPNRPYDLGWIVNQLLDDIAQEENNVTATQEGNVMKGGKDLYKCLEALSINKTVDITPILEKFTFEDEVDAFQNFCIELDAARQAGAVPKDIITERTWSDCLSAYRNL